MNKKSKDLQPTNTDTIRYHTDTMGRQDFEPPRSGSEFALWVADATLLLSVACSRACHPRWPCPKMPQVAMANNDISTYFNDQLVRWLTPASSSWCYQGWNQAKSRFNQLSRLSSNLIIPSPTLMIINFPPFLMMPFASLCCFVIPKFHPPHRSACWPIYPSPKAAMAAQLRIPDTATLAWPASHRSRPAARQLLQDQPVSSNSNRA